MCRSFWANMLNAWYAWLLVIVRIKSLSSMSLRLSCLTTWFPIRICFSPTARKAFSATGFPKAADKPLEETSTSSTPAFLSIFLNMPSAIGLLQVFPVHRKSTFIASLPFNPAVARGFFKPVHYGSSYGFLFYGFGQYNIHFHFIKKPQDHEEPGSNFFRPLAASEQNHFVAVISLSRFICGKNAHLLPRGLSFCRLAKYCADHFICCPARHEYIGIRSVVSVFLSRRLWNQRAVRLKEGLVNFAGSGNRCYLVSCNPSRP